MKRITALILSLFLFLTLLAGCAAYRTAASQMDEGGAARRSYGAQSNDAYESSDYGEEEAYWDGVYDEPAEVPQPAAASGKAAAAEPPKGAQTAQKLIYTADLDMETLDFDAAVAALADLTAELGGYFASSSLSDTGSSRWASYTIRIPAENYRAFLDQAGEQCHVLTLRECTEDVSESYYDTAGRLATQQTKLSRLQELLEEAKGMEDIILLEDAISETEEMIDWLSGTLRHYDALVDYSTVDVWLEEVKVYEPEPDPTYGSRLGEAFTAGLRSFVRGLGDILVGLAYCWLWLVLIAAVVALVLWLTRKRRAERRQARAERKALRAARKAPAAPETGAEETKE